MLSLRSAFSTGTAPFFGYLDFIECRNIVDQIVNHGQTINGIDNQTLEDLGYRYYGDIIRLNPPHTSEDVLALTYKGCVALCGEGTRYVGADWALEMITTWIFPLAVVLCLPYESMHRLATGQTSNNQWRRRFGLARLRRSRLGRTFFTSLRWLGCPQGAIAATMHNFLHIWKADRLTPRDDRGQPEQIWNDKLYVLTCLGQFETIDPADASHRQFLEPLLYGLFRPTVSQDHDAHADGIVTHELLMVLAHQLRMLRRRAVIPTLTSLWVYVVAFAISVPILFIEVGNGSLVAPLVLGLLFSWLPVLVALTIVDRNPISSERAG